MRELIDWTGLQEAWARAQDELIQARKELDRMVKDHLEKKADPPLLNKLREIDDLIHREADARGAIDEFISDLCH